MNSFLDTGHGTGIDNVTLKGVIHDDAAFALWVRESGDPVLDVIGPLFRGDLDTAERELVRVGVNAAASAEFRLRALGADILRDRGRFDEAVARYQQLLAEYAGTRRESVLWQHLGKVHFVAGHHAAAQDCFAAALQLRRTECAPADLIESSRLALQRAAEEHLLTTPRRV